MRQSLALTTVWAGLVAAHGHVSQYIIDGNTYPSFDPAYDYEPKYNAKRIEYGFAKGKMAVGPVENPNGLEINCRFRPLQTPGIEGVARAGSNITFKWLDWFESHKGPVITWMGLLPESGKTEDVEFFKIDEATYDPQTVTWGTDWLMKNKMQHSATIPSDIKAGTYVVRHEIISLHNAMNDDFVKKQSGAQFYPQCIKLNVIGDGTATPKGGKFPGTYKWDEPGILVNIFYHANEYTPPGPPVYKPAVQSPPKGSKPVLKQNVALTPAEQSARGRSDRSWEGAVHGTDAKHPGGGGCMWAVGADPKTAKCANMNPKDPNYKGFAQPPQSPAYVDQAHMDRSIVKFGPHITYLFDPTKPRWEERVKAGESPSAGAKAGGAAPRAKGKGKGRGKASVLEA